MINPDAAAGMAAITAEAPAAMAIITMMIIIW